MSTFPLRDRMLDPGRGRVYRDPESGTWFADYRAPDWMLFGAEAFSASIGADWCRDLAAALDPTKDPIRKA